MGFALLFALQTAAVSVPSAVAPIDFDLARHRPAARGCARGSPSEIIVCGQRGGGASVSVEELDRRYGPKKIRAERALRGGGTARAFTESVPMPRGDLSKRVMVGIKVPF